MYVRFRAACSVSSFASSGIPRCRRIAASMFVSMKKGADEKRSVCVKAGVSSQTMVAVCLADERSFAERSASGNEPARLPKSQKTSEVIGDAKRAARLERVRWIVFFCGRNVWLPTGSHPSQPVTSPAQPSGVSPVLTGGWHVVLRTKLVSHQGRSASRVPRRAPP